MSGHNTHGNDHRECKDLDGTRDLKNKFIDTLAQRIHIHILIDIQGFIQEEFITLLWHFKYL